MDHTSSSPEDAYQIALAVENAALKQKVVELQAESITNQARHEELYRAFKSLEAIVNGMKQQVEGSLIAAQAAEQRAETAELQAMQLQAEADALRKKVLETQRDLKLIQSKESSSVVKQEGVSNAEKRVADLVVKVDLPFVVATTSHTARLTTPLTAQHLTSPASIPSPERASAASGITDVQVPLLQGTFREAVTTRRNGVERSPHTLAAPTPSRSLASMMTPLRSPPPPRKLSAVQPASTDMITDLAAIDGLHQSPKQPGAVPEAARTKMHAASLAGSQLRQRLETDLAKIKRLEPGVSSPLLTTSAPRHLIAHAAVTPTDFPKTEATFAVPKAATETPSTMRSESSLMAGSTSSPRTTVSPALINMAKGSKDVDDINTSQAFLRLTQQLSTLQSELLSLG